MPDNAAIQGQNLDRLPRFCVVLRGEYLSVPSDKGDEEQLGFYVVRTVAAGDQTTAEKLALFDLEAEIRMKGMGPVPDTMEIDKSQRLDDDQEDVNSGFILYPAEQTL
ncbi:MAG TPA: hypothetical protein EYH07_06890 [Kiloniellaceae bacterium]|nr:hypothetical protein [Kiloniellaceae bacterium]